MRGKQNAPSTNFFPVTSSYARISPQNCHTSLFFKALPSTSSKLIELELRPTLIKTCFSGQILMKL